MKPGNAIMLATAALFLYDWKQRNRRAAPVFLRKKLYKNYNARTIPPFGIFIKESERENWELLEHEMEHWRQYQKKGLIGFYLDYNAEMKKFGYDRMPMELAARKNETAYCQENYTECVRNGTALTVYNPNFRT